MITPEMAYDICLNNEPNADPIMMNLYNGYYIIPDGHLGEMVDGNYLVNCDTGEFIDCDIWEMNKYIGKDYYSNDSYSRIKEFKIENGKVLALN